MVGAAEPPWRLCGSNHLLGSALRQPSARRHTRRGNGHIMPSPTEEARRLAHSHHPSERAQSRAEPTGEVADTKAFGRPCLAPTPTGERYKYDRQARTPTKNLEAGYQIAVIGHLLGQPPNERPHQHAI